MKVDTENYISSNRISEQKEKDLKKACNDFESVFTYQLLKSMRSTIDKCDLFNGGHGEEIYESLLDQEYSKLMAGSGSNSLSEALYKQLSNNVYGLGHSRVNTQNESLEDEGFNWPIEAVISSKYGWRNDPFTGEKRFHKGIDLAAPEGTDICASLPGRVVRSEYQQGYGNMIVIDHGAGITTLYAHNKINLVEPGDLVGKGTTIAQVGTSGRSTGSHLHFEVRKDGGKLNPMKYLTS